MKKTSTKNIFKKLTSVILTLQFGVFLTLPTSTNYILRSFEFGGGGDSSSSTNYSIESILGEDAAQGSSTNYSLNSGLAFVQQSHVPPAPTFVNSASWYNKLKITINQDDTAPTDTTYAIAISDDNWVTTEWVQSDNTVGATLGIEDFQTYTNWGGASGEFVTGLTANTTYKVKVKSRQGNYTESPLGPEASAATVSVSLTFDIDVSSSDTETASPYSVAFGDLTVGSISTATNKVWIDIDTNAEAGGYIYISDVNTGLKSSVHNYTISSLTADLTGQNEGFGIQSSTVAQSSGGPLAAVSPYDGASENVGIVDTTVRELYSTSSSPITAGRGSFTLKTKASNTTPAADDYADTLTVIASGTF
ncbi:hypothetical protein A3C24_00020 [Candidatus Roizmanbacteria bacterium RIFCSPHIGHO2_02_FULL_37_24]|uniref:Uncharacterized protein n=1 Tax=Candidatus Roizmanbacteria bacterium RIFCSPHIGHO2_02_FULL_37_24 TaxID=1802037 RepID=A0A1F7GUI0_9BACT|nr:MAG: hypothetical protein A3C24_00020 [Candidatus Roizmanbacteria bacterium RIFCSPHIGHO2_02_FULL_37_24]OGK32041.1 MAG: hypothetical protein A3E10_04865 [Candidatus Roizmanbacteria bacterium RIFCSPHIGHO2_12_FULL_37_23]